MEMCIFGGAFDPPHIGHFKIAETALKQLHCHQILWVPSFDSPQKETITASFEDRIKMLNLELGTTNSKNQVLDIESRLPAPSYTYNTVLKIKSQFPRVKNWYLLMGMDNWLSIKTWFKWEQLLKEVQVAVYPRDGLSFSMEKTPPILLTNKEIHLASSQIRDSLGTHPQTGVPTKIAEYIQQNNLYQKRSI